MANEKQLKLLKDDWQDWNEWRAKNPRVFINLTGANLREAHLGKANLGPSQARIGTANYGEDFVRADLSRADLYGAHLSNADLSGTDFREANLCGADLRGANFNGTLLIGSNFLKARLGGTILINLDLSKTIGLEDTVHDSPSSISTNTLTQSKGKVSESFLRGCGLSDWEIEQAKLYNPDLSNEEINNIQYKIYDLRATQALQISPLFISYSHIDGLFVDKIEKYLNNKGIRFWRDIHDLRAGRMEKQIDRAIRQNPTVLLVLSEHSLSSDWVEHEVRTAREVEKTMRRDVLCPVALDDSWKSSRWPKRVMEQIMEYNILDFSSWRDGKKFDSMFLRLIDGLELFYKG